MMESVQTSETLVNSYQPARRYNPEDGHLRVFTCLAKMSPLKVLKYFPVSGRRTQVTALCLRAAYSLHVSCNRISDPQMGNNLLVTIVKAVFLLPVVHGGSPHIVFILADDVVSVAFVVR
jgi:hypothetical protein